MYAKIENGVAIEYPLYEGDLERRFPSLRFPLDDPNSIVVNGGYIIPEGYVRVVAVPPGEDIKMNYTQNMPLLDATDGLWKEVWVATPKTPEELTAASHMIAFFIRRERDKKLLESDIHVMADRWDSYDASRKQEWTDYRQALRDIPLQLGFPIDVVWPITPSLFTIRAA